MTIAMVTSTESKIRDLQQLSEILATHKRKGQKVVHCHGVFDLLHIGHIRHFEEAKKNGDILVVTITSDRYVNKGPHRPAFTQALRAEAIGALACVDYVAVNDSPMAIELIKLLKPDFYVKGSDYKDAEKDVTGGITLEKEAVEFVGGQIAFTDDIVFSASTLINRHLSTLSRELTDYLESFSAKYSAEQIAGYLEKMAPLKVLTIGETIIDEYRYCHAIGKSSKEPMLAVKQLSAERFAGGTLALANNVAAFSDNVTVLSQIGDNDEQEEFLKSSLKDSIDARLLPRKNSPTIVKTRFIENGLFTKLFEVYTINDAALEEDDNNQLCDALEQLVPQFDAVVVIDFGHSMLTADAVKVICSKARFLAMNTQSNAGNLGFQNPHKFSRADYVCITENEARLAIRDRTANLKDVVEKLAQELQCERVVVTRGQSGCICFSAKEGYFEIPSLAGQIIDRMGAGDAFLSVTSLAAALGAPLELIGFIGNAVGAQAVATVGHRESISRASLIKFITTLLK